MRIVASEAARAADSARRRKEDAARGEELHRLDIESSKLVRRLLFKTLGGVALCCAAGIACIGLAMHSTDLQWGKMAFWSGMLIGDGGSMWLLIRYALRREEING